MHRNHSLTLAVLLAAVFSQAASAGGGVPYPAGYRDWRHVKSMVIQPGHPLHASFGGIHHLYANPTAWKGYQSGRFADGSVIVFDLLEAESGGNAITEGKRKVLGVMHKNSQKYAATGGWGFEGFAAGNPASRAVKDNAKAACFDCHAAQKDKDYVFSTKRD